jgi:dTDP-4-amino-4,6-dideoxygalactose transaminase
MNIPLVRPAPPRLSLAVQELQSLEESGIFSNFGPVNTQFEQEMLERFFGGQGACMTVCNATIGLMLAISEATGRAPAGRYALMPSFTFAATAHAAVWCRLTPLLCDIHPRNWAADPAAETALLQRHAGDVAVIVPYATFGFPIDTAYYRRLQEETGVPVVIDAAASLGTLDAEWRGFGTGFDGSVVFSMHATKSFAVGEAGLIYSANPERIARLRAMCNFGFGEPRTATMPGLNGKLSEVGALQGKLRLEGYSGITAHRAALYRHYRDVLPELQFQSAAPGMQAHQFVPALLPRHLGRHRAAIRSELADRGITTGTYFSPHLYQQPYFQEVCLAGSLEVCDDVASRMISLPLFDVMTHREVDVVAQNLRELIAEREPVKKQRPSRIGPFLPAVHRGSSPGSRRLAVK